MTIWTAVVGCLCLGLVGTLVTVARGAEPGPKRTHLFENDDGERENPFADLTAGAEAAAEGCRECGSSLTTDSYTFCVSCGSTGGSAAPADD